MKLTNYYKEIVGLKVKLTCSKNISSEVLLEELRYYQDSCPDKYDIQFCFYRPENYNALSNNPSSHFEYTNGMGVNWGGYSVIWTRKDKTSPPVVYFYLNLPERRMVNKLKGMQFTHPYEEIGQIFHEGVLQQTLLLYFSNHLTLIHGSAVLSPSGEAIVFGGTGGVGKTSLELELILNNGYYFIADDISILDNSGFLVPNFNLPKIYGYNLLGYKNIEEKLFKGKTFQDKLWWKIQKGLKKPNKFRRRADIDSFYSGKKAPRSKLNRFVVLYRSAVLEPSCKIISPQMAAEMNTAVMYTEFARLFNSLKFHEFNRKKESRKTLFSFDRLIRESEENLVRSLHNVECSVLEVPMDFSASDIKEKIPLLLGI